MRLLLLIAVVLGACGESRHELYMQGMKVEGDAERGPCKLVYDQEEGANVLSGDQVQSCLKMQEEAQALYDRAAALGMKDADFLQTRETSQARIKRLSGLLKMVREMEQPEFK